MPTFRTLRSRRGGALLRLAVAFALLLPAGVAVGEEGLPKTEDELVATVRTAIDARDMAAFDKLINWEGASPFKRRMVSFEVRRALGRSIRSIALEPFPEDGLRRMEVGGVLKANMPVTHRLRVVYDEPPMEGYGIPPTSVFLVGREGDGFRVALVVRAKTRDDD